MFEFSDITAKRFLKKMVEKEILSPIGENKSRKYVLRKK
jgi:hypothetical protein